jgi:hypothetical protein
MKKQKILQITLKKSLILPPANLRGNFLFSLKRRPVSRPAFWFENIFFTPVFFAGVL